MAKHIIKKTTTLFVLIGTLLITYSCNLPNDYFRHKYSGISPFGNESTDTGENEITKYKVEEPILSESSDELEQGTTVYLTCSTENTKIYYNLGDGTQNDPDNTNGELYNPETGITIYNTTTIKARAFKEAYEPSNVISKEYTTLGIFVAGRLTVYDNLYNNIVRISEDGTIDTSFNPGYGPNNNLYSTAQQEDGKILISGSFSTYNGVSRSRIARLNSDGSIDTNFNPGTGANDSIYSVKIQSDGKILIGGNFSSYRGVSRSKIARINSDGTLDTSFTIGTGVSTGGYVSNIELQNDGKILIAGYFSSYNGISSPYLARLNSDGSIDTSFNIGTGFSFVVTAIAIQEDSKILVGGSFTSYNGTAISYIARLNSDGSLDSSFNAGLNAKGNVYSIVIQNNNKILVAGSYTANYTTYGYVTKLNMDGTLYAVIDTTANDRFLTLVPLENGKMLVGGDFTVYKGVTKKRIAMLNQNGDIDTGFFSTTSGASGRSVKLITRQNDGKFLVIGDFTTYNGSPRAYLAKLNQDGSINNNFLANGLGTNGHVYSIAFQKDGKILVGGYFGQYNNINRGGIARLNTDGTLDTSFLNTGAGANYDYLESIAIQDDSKILIVGRFTTYNNTTRNRIARLNSNGSLDTTFDPGSGANNGIKTVAIQSDNKILIAGSFTSYNGIARNYIARLNDDGSLDTTFDPGTGTNSNINFLKILKNGKIIIIGAFTTYNGTARARIARLNPDGSLDTDFNPGSGANNEIISMDIQSDDSILIAGAFTTYNGTARGRVAKLNSDGSLDSSFLSTGSGANSSIYSITIQKDNKVIIGGFFDNYNGVLRKYLARLNDDGSLDDTFLSDNRYGPDDGLYKVKLP